MEAQPIIATVMVIERDFTKNEEAEAGITIDFRAARGNALGTLASTRSTGLSTRQVSTDANTGPATGRAAQ